MPNAVRSDIGRWAMVPEWLIDTASSNAIKVFATMAAKYADRGTDSCDPRRRVIASDADLSVSTVDRALVELVNIGAVERLTQAGTGGAQVQNLYVLHFVRPLSRVNTPLFTEDQGPLAAGEDPCIEDPESLYPEGSLNPMSSVTDDSTGPTFDNFWASYPRPKTKAAAQKSWERLSGADRLAAVAGAVAFANSAELESAKQNARNEAKRNNQPVPIGDALLQFVPHGSTFLNQRRWEDDFTELPARGENDEQYEGWAA